MLYNILDNLEEIYNILRKIGVPHEIIFDNILPFCRTSFQYKDLYSGSDLIYINDITEAQKNYERRFFRIKAQILHIPSYCSFWDSIRDKDVNELSLSKSDINLLFEIGETIFRWVLLLESSIYIDIQGQKIHDNRFYIDKIMYNMEDKDIRVFLFAFLRGNAFSLSFVNDCFDDENDTFLGHKYYDFIRIYSMSWLRYYTIIEQRDEKFKWTKGQEHLKIVPDDKRIDMFFLKYRIDVDEASKVANTFVEIYRFLMNNREYLENC